MFVPQKKIKTSTLFLVCFSATAKTRDWLPGRSTSLSEAAIRGGPDSVRNRHRGNKLGIERSDKRE